MKCIMKGLVDEELRSGKYPHLKENEKNESTGIKHLYAYKKSGEVCYRATFYYTSTIRFTLIETVDLKKALKILDTFMHKHLRKFLEFRKNHNQSGLEKYFQKYYNHAVPLKDENGKYIHEKIEHKKICMRKRVKDEKYEIYTNTKRSHGTILTIYSSKNEEDINRTYLLLKERDIKELFINALISRSTRKMIRIGHADYLRINMLKMKFYVPCKDKRLAVDKITAISIYCEEHSLAIMTNNIERKKAEEYIKKIISMRSKKFYNEEKHDYDKYLMFYPKNILE